MLIQNIINNFIIEISAAEKHLAAYALINSVASYLAIAVGILHGRKLRVAMIPVIIVAVTERLLAGPLATAILFVENGFSPPTIANAVVAFPYIPLLGVVLARILRRSWKELCDLIMIPPLVMFVGARIACTVAGCCRGYPCEWGIYNANTGTNLFPIQLVESFATLMILLYVFYREKKNDYISDGRNVPIILVSYGIARFFLEFLHDNKKIIFGIASTQFHCVIMILVGLITLHIINKNEQQA